MWLGMEGLVLHFSALFFLFEAQDRRILRQPRRWGLFQSFSSSPVSSNIAVTTWLSRYTLLHIETYTPHLQTPQEKHTTT
jgi:hypothetical protein